MRVEREQHVHVEEQAIDEVDLEPQRAAQFVERLLRKTDGPKHRLAVERMEILRDDSFGIYQIAAEEVERQRQAIVRGDVGAEGVVELIGEARRFAGRRVAGENARPVPLVARVQMRRYPLKRRRVNHERLDGGGSGAQ